jgi:hypothetical protein
MQFGGLRMLTDEMIRDNPALMYWVDLYAPDLDAMGWGQAPLVDKYNMAINLQSALEDE